MVAACGDIEKGWPVGGLMTSDCNHRWNYIIASTFYNEPSTADAIITIHEDHYKCSYCPFIKIIKSRTVSYTVTTEEISDGKPMWSMTNHVT